MTTLIVTESLLPREEAPAHSFVLHPVLDPYRAALGRRRQVWFDASANLPLSIYAKLLGVAETSVVATNITGMSADSSQIWMASPYHAQLARDTVHLLAEGQLPFSTEDAEWLCDELNPMLGEEGMILMAKGAALLLCCREPMQAQPVEFGEIAGGFLPDRHPQGVDGGRLMRLMSEIQMHLHRHPSVHRRERGEFDIHGLWLWSPFEVPARSETLLSPHVATRNPCLQSIVDGRDARIIISEADRLPELLQHGDPASYPLPEHVLLTGPAHAVLLSKSFIPRIGKPSWQPKAVKDEASLNELLKGWAHAA